MNYESLSGYLKYVSNVQKVLDDLFVDRKIRFTQPAVLNDPLDCNPILSVPCDYGEQTIYNVNGIIMPSSNLWYHIQLIESRVNEFGMLSLTKNPYSFDMWSKYANGHKGCLIEFTEKFNEDKAFCRPGNGEAYPVVPINYVDVFRINLNDCLDSEGLFLFEQFENKYFYTKDKRWEPEKEYRLVRPLKDLGKPSGGLHIGTYRDMVTVYLSDLPFDRIRSITFGACMPTETKKWIIEKCRNTSIAFHQCFLYPDELDETNLSPLIRIVSLDSTKMMERFMAMQPQLFSMARTDLLNEREMTLEKIEDLPYFNGFEKLVRLMYEHRKNKKIERGN